MLSIENLYIKYKKNDKYSIEDLSLNIYKGEIFGFLGQNGAGKSTTIKAVVGVLPYQKGSIIVCGNNLAESPNLVKQDIGYISSDERTAYESLTGREYLNFISNIYGIEKDLVNKRLTEYSVKFKMTEILDFPISTYSFGFKQLINLLALLIRQPKLWLLDEPFVGLAPEVAEEIKNCMQEAKERGSTIFFSSHYINLLDEICDRVAIIKKGKLVEIIEVSNLKNKKDTLQKHYFDLINKPN